MTSYLERITSTVDFSDLVGKTIEKIDGKVGEDTMLFYTKDARYMMYHEQD